MSDILKLIGNTPLVELKHVNANPNVRILAKLEGNNPGGSVKDRAAYGLIKGGLDSGLINKDSQLIEATSGNTGIALAMIASMFGLKIELVMPENSSIERVLSMRAYGANVTLTPAEQGMEGAISYARDKVTNAGFVSLDQFNNPNNPRMHYKTTGPEIYRDTEGKVTHFVSAMGTTGTIMGVSRYLKEQNPDVQVIGAQPADNAKIPGIRKWPVEFLPGIYQAEKVDQLIQVTEAEATAMTRRLAREEGVFAGMSSGGAVHVAVQIASKLDSGVVVCIICDRGDKYLSTNLFNEN